MGGGWMSSELFSIFNSHISGIESSDFTTQVLETYLKMFLVKHITNSVALSPQVNYTD
jgi:hypothetical protein